MASAEKVRIAFLCSGGGGNLRFLHTAIQRDWLNRAEIATVITDRDCPANQFATAVGIPNQVVDFSEAEQQTLAAALTRFRPDLIITTVHRILKPAIVAAWRGKLINLHYSLLPAFGGAIGSVPLKSALQYGARFTGVTVHHVDETVDGGKPIVQVAIPIRSHGEEFDELMDVVFRSGCIALLTALQMQSDQRARNTEAAITLSGRICLFNSAPTLSNELLSDLKLWGALKSPISAHNP